MELSGHSQPLIFHSCPRYPLHILYVEDSPELRETIAMLMEGPGRTIVACADAEQALQHEQQQGPFDLVVSDVSLPGLSGIELCRRLLHADPQRHVVLCTGHALQGEPALASPQVRVLHKPFDITALEELLDDIQARLQGQGSGVA